jgi:hypothetical protein
MATKTEWFRYQAERSGPKRPKRVWTEPGTHEPVRAGRKAIYVLEDSAGRPSRKSTRKSSNRSRNDVQMRDKRQVGDVRRGSGPGGSAR